MFGGMTAGAAAGAAAIRAYFYVIDVHGQLFLHDTVPKNFTTCFKDKRFLNFFFKQLRPNTTGEHEHSYPWISPCGREVNYIAPEDTPVVFQSISNDGKELTWAGDLRFPFQPDRVMLSPRDRLYHPSPVGTHALLRSSVGLQLMEALESDEGGQQYLRWQGQRYPLRSCV